MPDQTPIIDVNDICKTFEIPGRPPIHALVDVTNWSAPIEWSTMNVSA